MDEQHISISATARRFQPGRSTIRLAIADGSLACEQSAAGERLLSVDGV
jgi:hypothetical protein